MSAVPLPLSVYIIASNEADRVGRTIAAAKALTDDIVVVEDGRSTDGTVAVAQAAGARVLVNSWPGFGEQKRFAEAACRHDWLLCLDADEVPTPELIAEIRNLFAAGEPPLGFYNMKLVEVYPVATRPRPLAKRVNVVRLFDRRQGRTSTSAVHDRVETNGAPIGQLQAICLHYSIRSLAHLIRKYDDYTTLAAGTLPPRSGPYMVLRLLFEFPAMFLRYWIIHTHITGGLYGFAVATIKGFTRWARTAKMLERAWRQH